MTAKTVKGLIGNIKFIVKHKRFATIVIAVASFVAGFWVSMFICL